MDESNLTSICSHNSFYISLQDQKNAATGLENTSRALRQDLSTDLTTRVHFAVHCDQHWAAVQLCISPFGLRALPEQKFFRSFFRYTWCCGTARRADNSSEVFGAVQRIYDYYYQPSPWNFSSQYCRSSDAPTPESCSNEITCAKKTESALVGYVQLDNDPNDDEFPLADSDVDDVNAAPANRFKRRRLNTFQEINHDRNHDKTNEPDDEGDGTDEEGDGTDEEDDAGNDEENGTGDGDNTMDIPSTTCSSVAMENVTVKAIETVSNKIRKALDEMFPGEKKKGKANQLQVQARCIDVVCSGRELYSTDVIPSDFEARFTRGEFATKDRSLCLENLLWQQSSRVLQGAQEIAWKGSFTAACIRNIRRRTPSLSEETGASQSTITRWTNAAWMINLIVDGLWLTWGPKAALIYEALALKNYSLSRIVKFSENTLCQIIQGVVNNLRDSTPLVLGSRYVFHPAACISSALGISYEETCLDLGLKRSFSKLDPPQNLQSHTLLSLLLDQWDRYLATLPVEPVTSTRGYDGGGASISSQLDALTAVAQSILATDHLHHSVEQSGPVDMPTALVESFAVENADAEQSVCRDSQQYCSQTNAFNSQHTNYSALSIGDQQIHLAGSSSTLGGLASYSDMPTDSTLHTWVLNGPQGVDGGPDTRMDAEGEALHLWKADDLLNRPNLYETVQFENLLHLWEADDLANYPHLYEPIDLGWLDSLGDGVRGNPQV